MAPFLQKNRFVVGRASVTPAVRLENIYQSIQERLNLGTGETPAVNTDVADDSSTDVAPLVGLGFEYEFTDRNELYANVSQGYKAKTYSDTVPVGPTDTVSRNLEPGTTWSYELGFRGGPAEWITYDTSVFVIDYDNRFGRVGSNLQNVGRSINAGVDAATQIDVITLYDTVSDSRLQDSFGSLSLYGNVEFLDAEFVSGPLQDNKPQYAPGYLLRAGAIYRWRDRAKLALMGTFVDEHFADDGNSANFKVPSYAVWDLTLEAKVFKNNVSVIAGINNLFDERYYSRIRSTGIDPANRRNFYGGLALSF